jgi:hypothetical protein
LSDRASMRAGQRAVLGLGRLPDGVHCSRQPDPDHRPVLESGRVYMATLSTFMATSRRRLTTSANSRLSVLIAAATVMPRDYASRHHASRQHASRDHASRNYASRNSVAAVALLAVVEASAGCERRSPAAQARQPGRLARTGVQPAGSGVRLAACEPRDRFR